MVQGPGCGHYTHTHRPTNVVQDYRSGRIDCVRLVFGTMVRPKDNISLPIFTTPLAFGYTNRISFKIRHGQGASPVDTYALDGFFGDASL